VLHEQWPNDFCSGDGFSSSDGIPSLLNVTVAINKVQSFSADQFLFAFAQLTGREACAISKPVCARSSRSFIIWVFAAAFLATHWRTPTKRATGASSPIRGRSSPRLPVVSRRALGVELDQTSYALDSTPSICVWRCFPGAVPCHKSAVKVHTLLDLRAAFRPMLCDQRRGARYPHSGPTAARSGSVLSARRGYLDFARLYVLKQGCAFFITRAKQNTSSGGATGAGARARAAIRSDHSTHGPKTRACTRPAAPHPLLRCPERSAADFSDQQFPAPALTIANCIARAGVWSFFSLDQTTSSYQSFFGTSENAVKTQVWWHHCLRARGHCQKAGPLDLISTKSCRS